jgi:DNA-binding phage protein
VIPEDLEAARREVNGGIKVAKAAEQGLYDHVEELRQYRNGLERQAKHLERILKKDGLKESQVNRMNTIIERARGMSDTILNAITARETM